MSNVKIIHVDDLEPRLPPTRRVFVPLPPSADAPVHVGFVFMEPGGLMTPAHYHTRKTEVYFVLKGNGIITLNGEDHEVGQYGTVVVPPGVTHIWRNPHQTPLEYLWIMHPVDAESDAISVDTPSHIIVERTVREGDVLHA
ncbi:MAG TPA: cupin domain-containing protein [Chloroflexota bacterium]|nr:cupin domain-containing protein [Chloroflexota bacterium]